VVGHFGFLGFLLSVPDRDFFVTLSLLGASVGFRLVAIYAFCLSKRQIVFLMTHTFSMSPPSSLFPVCRRYFFTVLVMAVKLIFFALPLFCFPRRFCFLSFFFPVYPRGNGIIFLGIDSTSADIFSAVLSI